MLTIESHLMVSRGTNKKENEQKINPAAENRPTRKTGVAHRGGRIICPA
jgi:hypothetical protein